jgi:hypothetical protein
MSVVSSRAYSRAMSVIAARNTAVLLPGSPDASATSGNGSPSVCASSYLGKAVTGTPPWSQRVTPSIARVRDARSGVLLTGLPRLFKEVDPLTKPDASGEPSGVFDYGAWRDSLGNRRIAASTNHFSQRELTQ